MKLFRKVLRITALDSPNVALALAQKAAGLEPTGEAVIPGVLSWEEYCERVATWDEPRKCVGLEARFWKGADALLFPPHWLDHSHELAAKLVGTRRQAVSVGVDPGEGSAETSMTAVDRFGLLEEEAKLTPDTNVIPGDALAFAQRLGVPAERIAFDAGGGGKQHAHALRAKGHDVRVIAFGEAVTPEIRRGRKAPSRRAEEKEERQAWTNRRSQMYGELRELMDPAGPNGGFAIPARCMLLRRQLAPIPLTRDGEGRLYLLPKNRKDPRSKTPTLTELIGMSPDRADSLVLAVHVMLHPERRAVAGAMKWGDG